MLYLKKFNYSSNQLGGNWIDRFKLRTSPSKLFTWGSTDLGRLGYMIRDVPPEKLTSNRNVKLPHNLTNFNDLIITDLKSNGFSFQILTNQGLFFSGNDYKRRVNASPGPRDSDYRKRMELTGPVGVFPPLGRIGGGPRILPINHQPIETGSAHRLQGDEFSSPPPTTAPPRQTNPNLRRPPDQIPELREFQSQVTKHDQQSEKVRKIESNFITKLDTQGSKIISISSGRMHFIGLSDDNKLYTWDTGNVDLKGILLSFPGLDNPIISKIKSGWNLSSFYTKGKLIVWFSRQPITEEQVQQNDFSSKCNYWIINDPRNEIIDWYLGPDFIIVLKKDGVWGKKVDVGHYYHNIEGHSSLEELTTLSGFNYWLKTYNSNGTNIVYSKITGGFKNFAIFTSDQRVLIGDSTFIDDEITSLEDLDDPKKPKEIPLDDIVEMEIGDYHYLALNSNSELFSWGLNSNNCGCLGIGDVEGEIKEPTKIDGKWIVITAAGWHSGGIQTA
ncbi:hypothetical protein CLIB1444_01S16006 [[Candida] jaroonii]|uniref:Uncharacterized protein n=1 Tax=[Candida] jaroonii TaxID=467808 RepID=A0ACA9Y2L3_9ASCO|nr:hypothetical protein CLIB1444_01S16006 [[Candida] jaroonii]